MCGLMFKFVFALGARLPRATPFGLDPCPLAERKEGCGVGRRLVEL